MRYILLSLLLFLNISAFNQTTEIRNIELNFILKERSATITLLQAPNVLYSYKIDSSTLTIYQDLPSGYYKLVVTDPLNYSEIRDSIWVNENQKITADIILGEPCPYNYTEADIPVCPINERDIIIPILYKNDQKKHDTKQKIMEINYITTGCVPKFYCEKHAIKI